VGFDCPPIVRPGEWSVGDEVLYAGIEMGT